MSKCLRCGAGSEWIQGKVPDEPKSESELAAPAGSESRAKAICDAINATLKPYQKYFTDATAMLMINQYRKIHALENELNEVKDSELMMKVKAPWTPEQVDALNRWQQSPHTHPFTCANADKHHADQIGGQQMLLATPEGWVCPACDYKQDWAHDFMFTTPPIATIE